MLLEVTHHSRFSYDEPVFLDVHSVRLRPRSDAAQQLREFSLTIDPEPVGRSESIDVDGNDVTELWFEGLTDHLTLEAVSLTETLRANPFDFLWQDETALPMRYPRLLAAALGPYFGADGSRRLGALSQAVAAAAEQTAPRFLPLLSQAVNQRCRSVPRETGEPLAAEETLRRGEGSCRDLAVLFIELARGAGFAARFVSGYYAPPGQDEHELHAWAEVYVPGGGWRGYDPSIGLAVADRHVAVASGAVAATAAPVTGSYRGRATSRLLAEVTAHLRSD